MTRDAAENSTRREKPRSSARSNPGGAAAAPSDDRPPSRAAPTMPCPISERAGIFFQQPPGLRPELLLPVIVEPAGLQRITESRLVRLVEGDAGLGEVFDQACIEAQNVGALALGGVGKMF